MIPEGFEKLSDYLAGRLGISLPNINITAFPGGFSNLTYLIESDTNAWVLRRPPHGLKIAKAHDMVREFSILSALDAAGYSKIPKPILCCEDESILGAPFFLMEKVDGLIIRNKTSANQGTEFFKNMSINALDVLLELHQLELTHSGIIKLGKPEGYLKRQVDGWAERYFHAKTEENSSLESAFSWLCTFENQPQNSSIAFIHNDFKFDNLVVDEFGHVEAVLDWEMATVGDPLMDLGTTLAYWAEPTDPDILKMFNLSYVPGCLTRNEMIAYYRSKSKLDMSNMPFYYVFGLCKVAVIAQQIYKRFSLGFSKDPRFGILNQVVSACGIKAMEHINENKREKDD